MARTGNVFTPFKIKWMHHRFGNLSLGSPVRTIQPTGRALSDGYLEGDEMIFRKEGLACG